MRCKRVLLASAASLLLHSLFVSLTNATALGHQYRSRLSEKARTTQRIDKPEELADAAYELKAFATAPPPSVSGSGQRGIVISAGGEQLLSNAYVTAKVGTIQTCIVFCSSCPLHLQKTLNISVLYTRLSGITFTASCPFS